MAGHSHWKQIKEHKGAADAERSRRFGKLARAITVAARSEPNPQFNPRLRTVIATARAAGVTNDVIDRAVSRATSDRDLEEVLIEAYAPGGTPLLIHAITASRNRTIQEIRHILAAHGAKFAEPGSVRWAFSEVRDDTGTVWTPKFPQVVRPEVAAALAALCRALDAHDDVQRTFTAR